MHKNPMIQLEFLSLSQSCHLKSQEDTFICVPQWQNFYCKCLLVENSVSPFSGSRSLAACLCSSAGSSPDDHKFDDILTEKIAQTSSSKQT